MKMIFKILFSCALLASFATACVSHHIDGQCGDTSNQEGGTCSDTAQ